MKGESPRLESLTLDEIQDREIRSECLLHLAVANLRLAGQAGVTVPAMPGGSWKPSSSAARNRQMDFPAGVAVQQR